MLILILGYALEFYQCFVMSSLGLFVMEIASRSNEFFAQFLFPGSFSNALWMLLMLALGVKILKFRSKSSRFRTAMVVRKPEQRISQENEKNEEGKEKKSEKEESEVITLRKMVKSERRRRKNAVAELEKERGAAATAAEEAMAMILRLQREKSVIEMQAKQERRMAEQRQHYDQQVIRYLERIATEYEQTAEMTASVGGESEEDDSEKGKMNQRKMAF